MKNASVRTFAAVLAVSAAFAALIAFDRGSQEQALESRVAAAQSQTGAAGKPSKDKVVGDDVLWMGPGAGAQISGSLWSEGTMGIAAAGEAIWKIEPDLRKATLNGKLEVKGEGKLESLVIETAGDHYGRIDEHGFKFSADHGSLYFGDYKNRAELFLDGVFKAAEDSQFGKGLRVDEDLSVGDDVEVGKGLSVGQTVYVGETLNVNGRLNVTGDATLKGSLVVSDDVEVGAGMFIVDSAAGDVFIAGDAAIAGSLSVAGDLTSDSMSTGATFISGMLNGTGNASFLGAIKGESLAVESIEASGDLDLGGDANVQGNLEAEAIHTSGDLTVKDSTTFLVEAATGNLTVGGLLSANGGLAVTGGNIEGKLDQLEVDEGIGGAVIANGADEKTVALPFVPKTVQITPKEDLGDRWWVTLAASSFTLHVASPVTADRSFDYLAIK